jgi:hypothetical protein
MAWRSRDSGNPRADYARPRDIGRWKRTDEGRSKADEFVESYGADGIYEVLEERAMD